MYVVEYKALKEMEFNFSNQQFISKKKGNKVIIKQNENSTNKQNLYEGFYGSRISNISVIVGENGSGKSSLFEFINEELSINGHSKEAVEFIAIFKNVDNLFVKKRELSFKFDLTLITYESTFDGIPLIQYFPLPDITFRNPYLKNRIGSQRINISDNAMILEDFERELSKNQNVFFDSHYYEALTPFIISEIDRQVTFFQFDQFSEIQPSHILAIQSMDVEAILNDLIDSYKKSAELSEEPHVRFSYENTVDNLETIKEIFQHEPTNISTIDNTYVFIRTFSIMLLIDIQATLGRAFNQIKTEQFVEFAEEINKSLADCNTLFFKSNYQIEDFIKLLADIAALNIEHLNISTNAFNIYDLIKSLQSIEDYFPENALTKELYELNKNKCNGKEGNIYLFIREQKKSTFSILNSLIKIKYTSRIMKFEWLDDRFSIYNYSTGEQLFIKLFSRLYYGINRLDEVFHQHILLMLDEGEISMHPEWQRKYVFELVRFLNSGLNNKFKIQVILTTHSPFILSDIPDQNILRLDNGTPSKKEFHQTFGANIHELLAHDFFLKDGFMGEFAKEKIKALIEDLQSDRNFSIKEKNQLLTTIELIGEDIIRNSLLEQYRKKFGNPTYKELLDYFNQNQDGEN